MFSIFFFFFFYEERWEKNTLSASSLVIWSLEQLCNNNCPSECFVPGWHTMIRRVKMDKLSDTFKEKSQANVLILAHLCAADGGGKCCPPLSSAHLHSSVTEPWAQTRRRRWWIVARLEIVEKRHKVSFNVGNITHFISHVIFFFFSEHQLVEMNCPPLRALEPAAVNWTVTGVRWVSLEDLQLRSHFAVFVQLKHTSCVVFFNFCLSSCREARISCTLVLLLFVFIFSLSGFSLLLSSVICSIWFQGSLFPFSLVLNFVSFEVLTVGIPELILSLMFTGVVTFFFFFWSRLWGILNAVCQTFNFLWPCESPK